MKFRTIFALFNTVILLSFLFVFFLPFFLLGAEYSLTFWKDNWYLAAFFIAVLAVLNTFFLANWKVFILVENEDWNALSTHLVERIFAKKRYGNREVGLLVNAYLLQNDSTGIERLEAELGARRPELLRKNAVLFGVTYLLRNRPAEAESFLAPYLDAKDARSREWLRFDYAFSLVLQRRAADALVYLREGAASKDAVLSLLSAYLLGSIGVATIPGGFDSPEALELRSLTGSVRERLSKRFPAGKWEREIERAKNEVHIVILSKLIDDASRWLRENGPDAALGKKA